MVFYQFRKNHPKVIFGLLNLLLLVSTSCDSQFQVVVKERKLWLHQLLLDGLILGLLLTPWPFWNYCIFYDQDAISLSVYVLHTYICIHTFDKDNERCRIPIILPFLALSNTATVIISDPGAFQATFTWDREGNLFSYLSVGTLEGLVFFIYLIVTTLNHYKNLITAHI